MKTRRISTKGQFEDVLAKAFRKFTEQVFLDSVMLGEVTLEISQDGRLLKLLGGPEKERAIGLICKGGKK